MRWWFTNSAESPLLASKEPQHGGPCIANVSPASMTFSSSAMAMKQALSSPTALSVNWITQDPSTYQMERTATPSSPARDPKDSTESSRISELLNETNPFKHYKETEMQDPDMRKPVGEMTNTERARLAFSDAVGRAFDELEDTLLTKHRDYGAKNISAAPGGALNGLRVRMHDKLARINNLVEKGEAVQHESLRDSFLDLANYAVIGMLVLDEAWPSE